MDSFINKPKAVVALGMFDGVHIGHIALLKRAVEKAKKLGIKSYVFTFSNHPRGVFADEPKLLMTPDERRESILAAGIDEVNMAVFTKETTVITPRDYINQLRDGLDIQAFVVGYDYTFGDKGSGNPETLQKMSLELGFELCVIPPVLYGGEPVSSTRIRLLLETGCAEEANKMLNTPYTLSGVVEECRHIGASLGFPTANIYPQPKKVLPEKGVYVTKAAYDGVWYSAVTNVGSNPTVKGKQTTIESHLLDFSKDIYNSNISVEFYSKIRDEKLFKDKEALSCQIAKDINKARDYFKK